MFDAKTRARERSRTCAASATRSPAAAPAVGRTIEEAPRAASATSSRSLRNLADPNTAARRASSRSSATPRASSRPSPRPTRTCSRRWPTRGRRSGATPRRCKPVRSPSSPPTMDAAIASFRVQRPFLADLTTFSKDFSGATAELRGALPDDQPGARDRHARPEAGARAQQAPRGHVRRAPRPDRRRRRPTPRIRGADRARSPRSTRSCASTARSSRSATRRTTSSPTSPSTSPRPTAPARRSARCSTSPASRTTRSARWAPTAPANGENVKQGNKQYLHGRSVRRGDHARRARRLRGRPARLPRAQRPLLRQRSTRSTQDARTPGAQGPTYTGRAARAEGRDVHVDPGDRPVLDRCPASSSGER